MSAAVAVADRFSGKFVGERALTALFAPIRLRYGLTSLVPIVDGETWTVAGKINPEAEQASKAKVTAADGNASSEHSERDTLVARIRAENPDYLTIHGGRQGKHVRGHNNFDPRRSELTYPDAQSLLDRHAFTGTRLQGNPGQPGFRERIAFGEPIGMHVTPTGVRTVTTNGVVHYSAQGAHIVPAAP